MEVLHKRKCPLPLLLHAVVITNHILAQSNKRMEESCKESFHKQFCVRYEATAFINDFWIYWSRVHTSKKHVIAQLDHTIVKLRVTSFWRQIWIKPRNEPFGTNFFGVTLKNLGASLRQTLVANLRGKPWGQTLRANLGDKSSWQTPMVVNLGGKPLC